MNIELAKLIKLEHESDDPQRLRNAMLLNKAEICGELRVQIESILEIYNKGEITAADALLMLSNYDAQAKNDLRDGLVFIERLFEISKEESILETDEYMKDTYGTKDWHKLNKLMYPRVYIEDKDCSEISSMFLPPDKLN